jgi:hypothetical protein
LILTWFSAPFDEATPNQRAKILLAAGGTLRVQVLDEFVNVALRKLNRSWEEFGRPLGILRVFCPESSTGDDPNV